MRGRVILLGLITTGLGLFPSASPVRAEFMYTATQTQVLTPTTTNLGPGSTNGPTGPVINDPFVIQQFDPSKYATPAVPNPKLLGVDVYLQYEVDNQIKIAFVPLTKGVSTGTVNMSGGMQMLLIDSKGTTVSQNIVNQPTFSTSKLLTYNPTNPTVTQTSNPNYVSPVTTLVKNISAVAYTAQNDPTIVNSFVGQGVVTMPLYAHATSNYVSSSGNGGGVSDVTVSATVSVVYYYAPEPSGMILLGTGLVGLYFVTRSRGRRPEGAAA